MVKLIFLPKFEQQCARRIAHDSVAKGLLPMKPIVRIAICQDGRAPAGKSTLQFEAQYFQTLYNNWKYLCRPDITVQCYAFSFWDPPATLQQHLRELATTDIFFTTGFSPGRLMSEMLMAVFKNHAVIGNDERDQSCVVEHLFRAIKARVQYNQTKPKQLTEVTIVYQKQNNASDNLIGYRQKQYHGTLRRTPLQAA